MAQISGRMAGRQPRELLMSQLALRGRDADLATVMTAVRAAAAAGAGAMILIAGEPGIGKSALLRVAADQAGRAGFVVGVGKADEIDQVAPGAPLLVALRSGPQPLLDSQSFESLASLYDRQLWLVERISAILEDTAARAPVVIALDDVHWADRLTRFALRILPGRLAASPVVWILTSRSTQPQVGEELAAAADDDVAVTHLVLDPLADSHIDEMAGDRLRMAPDAAVRELLRGVGGNPFWTVQVLDGLARRKARGLTTDSMHSELVGGIHHRLQSVEPGAAALMRLVAVWGKALPVPTASRLLSDVTAAVLIAAREAEASGLLAHDERGIVIPHDLLREAVYADIPPAERDALHRLCGRYLLAAEPSALAAAPHFRAVAGRGDLEAVRALEQAAAHSAATMPDQAAELAQEAFALVPADHPLWLDAGQKAVALLARVQRESAVVATADRLIAGTKNTDAAARLEVQVCRALWSIGACREIKRRVDFTLRSDEVSSVARARLFAVRALASTRTDSRASAQSAAESALLSGRELRDEVAERLALLALTEVARNEGRHQAVLDRFTELRSISPTAYLADEIRVLQHLDRYDEADALLAKIRHEAMDNIDRVLPSFLYAQIWQDHNLARFDAAEAGAQTLLRLAWEIGSFTHEMNARMVLSGIAIYRGDIAAARTLLRPAELREESRDESRVSGLRLMQGWLAAEEGHLEVSIGILRPLMSAAAEGTQAWSWSPGWMRIFARVGLAAGDQAFAEAAAHVAELGAERNPGVTTMAGVALQVRGAVSQDPDALGRAVRILRTGPRPVLLTHALVDYAATLTAAGRGTAARKCLDEASARYDHAGVMPGALAGAAIRERTRIRRNRGAAAAPRPTHGLPSLTETERRVAELISAGHSSRSAAAELVVSPNTINTHLRSAFTKLDVRSRVQLANLLRDQA
jgi:DNA-binding CsgD family transcriptional regulator/tetratricopeptide (TPR) repeat protein